VKLIAKIAECYGVQITQKTAALAVPAIDAVGGAIINTLFIDHFQGMARGHFLIRKLERRHNPEIIRKYYELLEING
jgi:hypothetical protein